jgi:hypothetical protein
MHFIFLSWLMKGKGAGRLVYLAQDSVRLGRDALDNIHHD